LQTADSRIADCRLAIQDCRLPIHGLPIGDCRLTDCRLTVFAIINANPQSTIHNLQSSIRESTISNPNLKSPIDNP